eukprot:1159961-Pelagomonas_calceolata.AAC.10
MDKLADAARAVIDDLSVRFPPTDLAWAMGIVHPSWWLGPLPPSGEDAWPEAAHEHAHGTLQILNNAFCTSKLISNEGGSSSSVAAFLCYDKLKDQKCMYMHEILDFLQHRSKAPTSAPAPKPNNMSDRSSDSSNSSLSNSGCSSADEQEPARKKQALEPATMASKAVEGWVAFSALKRLKSPQHNSLKEEHTNVCARGFKSMECDFMSFPYPDAIGRWLDAKQRRGRYGPQGDVGKVQFAWWTR